MKEKVSLFWFRRDLRLDDNTGLIEALKARSPVLPIFIFDTEILENLPRNDARVSFIYAILQKMRNELTLKYSSSIAIYYGNPMGIFDTLIKQYSIDSVFTNHDYEPYAKVRDTSIRELLQKNGIGFKSFKDQVIFEKDEIVKSDGTPYVVYTPYKNKWKASFDAKTHLSSINTKANFDNFIKQSDLPNVSLKDIGFESSRIKVPDYHLSLESIEKYEETRNYPAIKKGTSRIGPHLRFGTVSIRKVIDFVITVKNEVYLNELIWREFFMQILWHFPKTINYAFKPKYDRIQWRNNKDEFEKWKIGQTGYPFVDAGMRELNETGFMHNRVRMLVASFLCKHLLIDWRWGEAFFAEKLLDYDLSANVGNWQWAAGSGVDAAPYFRIFNPTTQIEKFDRQKEYINDWVPELQEFTYPEKIVDHKMARERCLKVYKEALG